MVSINEYTGPLASLLNTLVERLQVIPGIGPRSATRVAFYLLQQQRSGGKQLAESLTRALDEIHNCTRCRNFCEGERCSICSNPKRDNSLLCIVELPIDLVAIERTHSYAGRYFVLMGRLSPLDGLGPKEIGMEQLQQLLQQEQQQLKEVIIATNPTVEGEATAHYLHEVAQEFAIKCSRIAHGIPFGGELEYTDSNTLAQAIMRRTEIGQ